MNIFNFIKTNVDILAVVQQYVTLKKAGGVYWKGQCPFHNERTGSFTVSPDKGIFYCFGCQETGDVISFIEKIEKLHTFDACKHIADQFQLTIPAEYLQNQQQSTQTAHEKKDFFHVCKTIALWCHQQLQQYDIAKQYLASRHFSTTDNNTFMLGYFPKSPWKKLLTFLAHHGCTQEDAEKAGVIFTNQYGLYSPYEQRIIFPIQDALGRYCGFGGRVFLPNDTRPKYYNSKESDLFQKSSLLFGLHHAKPEIKNQECAILVEGYTDCIALCSKGYYNTIATLGTACTMQHLQQLARHAKKVLVLYDADTAGTKAILRLTHLCWQVDLSVEVLPLPPGLDPAQYIEKYESLDELFKKKVDIFGYFFEYYYTEYQNASLQEKLHIAQDIIDVIAQLPDPLKRDLLFLQAAQVMQVSVQSLQAQAKKSKQSKTTTNSTTPDERDQLPKIPDLDAKIASMLTHKPELLTETDYLILEYVAPPLQAIFIPYYKQYIHEHFWETYTKRLTDIEQQLIRVLYFQAQEQDLQTSFSHLVQQFLKKHWKSIATHTKLQLQKASPPEQTKILEKFRRLQSKFLNHGRI